MRLRPLVGLLAALALGACSPLQRQTAQFASPSPLPVATGDYPMLGRDAGFSWISGRLERDLACTYLRFGSPRRSPWGGRIALDATPDQLAELRAGDTVVIHGELVPLAYGSCGAPTYLVRAIEEH